MNDTLLDISRKIEPHKAQILAAIHKTARTLGISFFVVGGAARDFILQNGFDIRTPRVTLDIDIGISVSSWDEFSSLIEQILTVENFKRTGIEHRFVSPTPQETKVDILPFGAIERKNRTVRWRQGNKEMDMSGFAEAYKAAVNVKISSNPTIVVKMVSLAGLALLKLISWNENPGERDRDAKDFKVIMYSYLEAHPTEYLYEDYQDIASDGDYDLVSARVLGRDIKTVAGPEMYPQIINILSRESDQDGRLNFVQSMQSKSLNEEPAIPRDIEMLKAVCKGVAD
jgi:predicted nucleotidyltransferase